MLSFQKTNSDNPDFQLLSSRLEEELRILDGDEHALYAQLNSIDYIEQVIIAWQGGQLSGCGAIRQYADDAMEIKRMYIIPEKRGLGIGKQLLLQLEQWTLESGFKKCMLETGRNQPDAIAFYRRNHYTEIPNFGKYMDSGNSVCFEKNFIS